MVLPKIILKIERWKFNKEYGVYVSTLGNFKDRYKRNLPVKINQGGYVLIKTEAPNSQWKLAHRLVLLTWKPIPDAETLTVDHLNHNKRDNALINLEWVTIEENRRRAIEDYMPKTLPVLKAKVFKVNDTVMLPDFDIVYNYIIENYYPKNYAPKKEKIKEAIDNLLSGANSSGRKRVGKKVMLSYV